MPNAQPFWASRRVAAPIAALLLAGAAVVVLITRSGAPARARPPAISSTYRALTSTAPTGLPLVSSRARANELSRTGPIFSAAAPTGEGGSRVLPRTIRKLHIPLATHSAWIAESSEGGVCVLVSSHTPIEGHYPLGSSCGTAANLTEGAVGELTADGSRTVTIVGVEPNGVTSVAVKLSDGTTETLPVSDNAWATEADSPVQSVSRTVGR
jgi:hypothetical protein